MKKFRFPKENFDGVARRGGSKMRSLSIRRVKEDERVKTGCWRLLPFPHRRFDIRCRSSCVLFSDISRSRWGGRMPSGSMNGNLLTQRYRYIHIETIEKAEEQRKWLKLIYADNIKIIHVSQHQKYIHWLYFSKKHLKYLK